MPQRFLILFPTFMLLYYQYLLQRYRRIRLRHAVSADSISLLHRGEHKADLDPPGAYDKPRNPR
jgi:hypothetical protein